MSTQTEMLIQMVVNAWQNHNKKLDDLIAKLSDAQWNAETAPGRNSGIYLLGHLTAVNDGMLTILGFGESLYPELASVFIFESDKSGKEMPTIHELKSYWHKVNLNLDAYLAKMQPADWFTRHTKISEEDFANEPHRNKLSILISRTNHQAYHLGQLAYLK